MKLIPQQFLMLRNLITDLCTDVEEFYGDFVFGTYESYHDDGYVKGTSRECRGHTILVELSVTEEGRPYLQSHYSGDGRGYGEESYYVRIYLVEATPKEQLDGFDWGRVYRMRKEVWLASGSEDFQPWTHYVREHPEHFPYIVTALSYASGVVISQGFD